MAEENSGRTELGSATRRTSKWGIRKEIRGLRKASAFFFFFKSNTATYRIDVTYEDRIDCRKIMRGLENCETRFPNEVIDFSRGGA